MLVGCKLVPLLYKKWHGNSSEFVFVWEPRQTVLKGYFCLCILELIPAYGMWGNWTQVGRMHAKWLWERQFLKNVTKLSYDEAILVLWKQRREKTKVFCILHVHWGTLDKLSRYGNYLCLLNRWRNCEAPEAGEVDFPLKRNEPTLDSDF